MTIHEKIKHIRHQKKMTQVEFADLVQITQGMLSFIEKGDQSPSFNVIWILVNKLHVNPYFLLSDDQVVFDTKKRFANISKRNQALKYIEKAVVDINGLSL